MAASEVEFHNIEYYIFINIIKKIFFKKIYKILFYCKRYQLTLDTLCFYLLVIQNDRKSGWGQSDKV